MAVIIEGTNGTFIGNQNTIFEAHVSVREACEKFKRREKISEEKVNEYIVAFNILDLIHGLNEEQQKCQKYLNKL